MSKFRKTKYGIAICPFFQWQRGEIEGLGQRCDDVSLVICCHKKNTAWDYEGNCTKQLCPLVQES